MGLKLTDIAELLKRHSGESDVTVDGKTVTSADVVDGKVVLVTGTEEPEKAPTKATETPADAGGTDTGETTDTKPKKRTSPTKPSGN